MTETTYKCRICGRRYVSEVAARSCHVAPPAVIMDDVYQYPSVADLTIGTTDLPSVTPDLPEHTPDFGGFGGGDSGGAGGGGDWGGGGDIGGCDPGGS